MPLNRCQIRNEYSLADPDLYKVADKDDPEALLEGVAMAGLVGVLRQLGDLAQFAAEIFHDLHEEVMATAGRGHDLIVRVQQLEAEFPSVEKTLLSQTSHTDFLYRSGIDWHPNLRMDQNLVAGGDLPRFVMDSYEECRGPPRLFLLDKFDVAGAGACLKRYTDPSFFKVEATSSCGRKSEGQREKKTRKVKKRGSRWRNGDTPESFPSSHAKLHQLFLEESIETGGNDLERRVKLKKRLFSGSLIEQDKGKSYMEKFLDTCPPGQKIVHEICIDPLNGCESGLEIVEIGTVSPLKESITTDKSTCSSPGTMEMVVKTSMDVASEGKSNEIIASEAVGVNGFNHETVASKISSTIPKVVSGEEYADGQYSDDVTSEIDNYMDALTTIESEVDIDSECKRNPHCLNLNPIVVYSDTSEGKRERQSYDTQSVGNSITSEDGINFFKERESSSCSVRVDTLAETAPNLNGAVVSVPSIPGSNLDLDKMAIDHHSMSEEIHGNEPEEHAARSTVATEADDGSKSVQHFGEASTSSNSSYMVAHLRKECLPSPESDEINSYSTEPDFMSGINNGGHASQGATWSCNGKVADASEGTDCGYRSHGEHSLHDTARGNSRVHSESSSAESEKRASVASSVEEHSNDLGRVDMGVCSDIGPPLASPPISDFRYSETVGPTDLAFKPTERISANQSSASYTTQGFNIIEQFSETMNSGHTPLPDFEAGALPSSPEDPSIKEVFADVQSEKERSSAPVVGQTEILPPMSSFSDTAVSEHHLSEVGKQYPVSISGDECNAVNVSASAKDAVCQDVTPIYYDQSYPVVTVKDLDVSETQVIHANATSDHGHIDNHDDKNEALHHDEQPVSITGDDHQNEEELSLRPTAELAFQKRVNSVQDAPENSCTNTCNMSSDGSPTLALLDGSLVENVQNDEARINLDAPPLPPLPPMQWRLSRFQNWSAPPERQMVQHTIGAMQQVSDTVSEASSQNNKYGFREDNLSFSTSSTFVNSQNGTQVSEDLEISSQNNMNGIRREDNLFAQTLSNIQSDNQVYEESYKPSVNPCEPGSLVEGHSSGHSPARDECLEHIAQIIEKEVKEVQPPPGLVVPESGTTWSSISDGIQTNADGNANGTLHRKPQRPRNPLIDEVVSIDKSKLRKVERVKSQVESKPEGEYLLEQMQLRKVERPVKPPVERTEEGESVLEHLQLRKFEERVKLQMELKTEERESLQEQLQLRKVGERVKPEVEQEKPGEPESPRVQSGKVGERVKPEVEQKPEETESPRVQLRKVSERAHPLVGSVTEDRDTLLKQIRNKSFNLKPAVVGRPNTQGRTIQGPRTNLKVAAMLEKASNIRQAMAGSDEEDDADNWSDC